MTADEYVELSEIPPSYEWEGGRMREKAALTDRNPTAHETEKMAEARANVAKAQRALAAAYDGYAAAVRNEMSKEYNRR